MGKGMWAQICADIGKARYAAGRRITENAVLITEGCGSYVILMLYEEEALSHVEKEKNNIRCRILKNYSYICSQNSV